MDWKSARHWPKGIGLLLAALLLLSLVSFHLGDPTFTNLRAHSQGTRNLLGLFGALAGGSLLELLGSSALLAPLLLANWFLSVRNRPPLYRYLFWCVTLLTGLAALHGLLAPSGDPGLTDPGLAGWAARRWVHLTTGVWAGATGLLFLTAYAAQRVLYQPAARGGFKDMALFTGWFLHEGRLAAGTGWKKFLMGAGRLRTGILGIAFAALGGMGAGFAAGRGALFHPFRRRRHRAGGISALSLAAAPYGQAWKHSPAQGGKVAGSIAGSAAGGAGTETGRETEPDPFDAWFAPSLEERGPDRRAGEPPQEIPPHAPGPSSPPLREKPGANRPDLEGKAAGANPAGRESGREDSPPPSFPAPSSGAAAEIPPFKGAAGGFEQQLLEKTAPLEVRDDGGGKVEQTERVESGGTGEPEEPELPEAREDEGEGKERREEREREDGIEAGGYSGHVFVQPEAESAWRERFQRYARNLDLDWQEQLWSTASEEDEEEGEPAADPPGSEPG